MSTAYANQLQQANQQPTKPIPTDAQLNRFKSDLLELAALVEAGDCTDMISQPMLTHLWVIMQQAYDIVQSYRS